MSWRSRSSAPRRSSPRPGPGWPGRRRKARPGWSACTIPMPGRSARAGPARPVEFGYKAQVTDNDDGIVLDTAWNAVPPPTGRSSCPPRSGSPAARAGSPRGHRRRGYRQATVERDLRGLGVRTVAIPRQAATSPARKAIAHGRAFRQLVNLPPASEVAHRPRRPDQLPQTRLRLGPHPPGPYLSWPESRGLRRLAGRAPRVWQRWRAGPAVVLPTAATSDGHRLGICSPPGSPVFILFRLAAYRFQVPAGQRLEVLAAFHWQGCGFE
jgi:hypothetical protein